MNKDTSFIRDYHEKTKHSEISVMNSQHYLDWNNRPYPFKIYCNLPTIPLPTDFSIPSLNAILAISRLFPQDKQYNKSNNINSASVTAAHKSKDFEDKKKLTLKDLATILFFSGGITREIKHGNHTFYMRAASATGALYPIEIYIVCKDISPELKAGIYHFCPAEFSLINIRKGDYRSALSVAAAAAADNQHILNSPLTIIFTSLSWRNAWKYQDRSYRHWFWDSGVIAANLLAITSSMNIISRLSMGFVDDEVDRLLALEKEKEASIVMATLEIESSPNFALESSDTKKEHFSYSDLPPGLKTIPLSRKEIQFPLIWKTHENSKLFSKNEATEWINSGISQIHNFLNLEKDIESHRERVLKRQSLPNEYQISNIPSIGETILRRGSTRKFARSSIPFTTLSSIIYNSTRYIPMDFKKDTDTLIDIYLISNDVEGIDSGGYFYNRVNNTLDLIKDKTTRNLSGYLCLGQSLFSDASVVLFLMSNLNKIIKTLGNRGYRASQFEAGIITGKIYLSAYAYGIGASGSTFYDDAATNFFSPHSENKNTMIAIGIGNPAYKARPGKILPVRLKREQLIR